MEAASAPGPPRARLASQPASARAASASAPVTRSATLGTSKISSVPRWKKTGARKISARHTASRGPIGSGRARAPCARTAEGDRTWRLKERLPAFLVRDRQHLEEEGVDVRELGIAHVARRANAVSGGAGAQEDRIARARRRLEARHHL